MLKALKSRRKRAITSASNANVTLNSSLTFNYNSNTQGIQQLNNDVFRLIVIK